MTTPLPSPPLVVQPLGCPHPLQVAMFVGSFPVLSETFILHQITGLIERGHEIDIYAEFRPPEDGPMQPEISRFGLRERTTYMDMPLDTHPWELPVIPLTGRTWIPGSDHAISNLRRLIRAAPFLARCFIKAPGLTRKALDRREYSYCAESLSAVYRLAKLCAVRKRYDILHAHFGPVGDRFRFAKELWQTPLVVSFYGYDFSVIPKKEGLNVYHRLFQESNRVIAISDYVRDQMKQLGLPSEKVTKIPLGLRLEEYAFAERVLLPGETVKILTVARLVEKKGIEFSIRAIAKVISAHPKLEYHLVGDGPLRGALEKLIGELGLTKHVHLHGAQDGHYVRARMMEAHLFVLASVTASDGDQEGQGLVLQEAQACGLPVVATNHAALPEGIAVGKSGFLVPERDVESLAREILELVRRPQRWAEMGRAGRRFVETRFDLHRINEQLESLYRELLKASR